MPFKGSVPPCDVCLVPAAQPGQAAALKAAQPLCQLPPCTHEALHARKGILDFLHEDTDSVIIVNYGLSLGESNTTENFLTPNWASVGVSETPGSVLDALINSPADKPQAHNEFIHCIQQPVIASSWQHGPSTSATSLGEISPGWQKSASDGKLGTHLFSFSAVIRIKSSCALPASVSKQDAPLPRRSWISLCYWLNKIPSLFYSTLL